MLALQGTSRLASAALLFFTFLFSGTLCRGASGDKGSTSDAVQLFSGRWDLTLKSPDREYPSWLEIHQENGHPVAQMVGRWGNARPIPKVEVSDREITFISPKEEEGSSTDLIFVGKPDGKALSGTLTGPNGARWTWSAVRAPLLQRESKPKWGKPISLFNGKDQTGGVYGFIAPSPELPRKPGELQSFDITLVGRTITVVQNGKAVIDHQEVPGITGGALDSHEELPGTIYLQGSEDNHVAFRNIILTPAEK